MARIDSHSTGATILPFSQVAAIVVPHGLDYHPLVEVLVVQPGGDYGFPGFGDYPYGFTEVYVPLTESNFMVLHEDGTFTVLLNNLYDGEVIYI